MKGQLNQAPSHSIIVGDEIMGKSFNIKFVKVGDDDQSAEIIRKITKSEIKKVLDNHGAVSYNLDDVLSKYITGEMRNDQRG
ncbi:hypothetical protein CHH67_19215 [Paenibacillus campinasensis]|uniref:Uncharacterized protein n=2 Tax=Paenibacillus campinasensis TaxID=66347 RepID=A0A268ELH8_9BACL|nr:hypothetical protein CHH67_19215 [Paenibacillus campinasensis]